MSTTAAEISRLYLLFRLQDDCYAIPATDIKVVLRRPVLKQCPGAPDWVAGLLHYQQQSIPVIDLYKRLLNRPASWNTSTRLALLHTQGQLIGLLLEQVHRAERLPDRLWQPSGLIIPDTNYLGLVQLHASLGLIQQVHLAALLPDNVRQILFAEAIS